MARAARWLAQLARPGGSRSSRGPVARGRAQLGGSVARAARWLAQLARPGGSGGQFCRPPPQEATGPTGELASAAYGELGCPRGGDRAGCPRRGGRSGGRSPRRPFAWRPNASRPRHAGYAVSPPASRDRLRGPGASAGRPPPRAGRLRGPSPVRGRSGLPALPHRRRIERRACNLLTGVPPSLDTLVNLPGLAWTDCAPTSYPSMIGPRADPPGHRRTHPPSPPAGPTRRAHPPSPSAGPPPGPPAGPTRRAHPPSPPGDPP